MLFWRVVLVLVVVSECSVHRGFGGNHPGHNHGPRNGNNNHQGLSPPKCEVDIRQNNHHKGSFKLHDELNFESGDVVELECRSNVGSTQWIDTRGFTTGAQDGDLTLRITADKYDNLGTLTCISMARDISPCSIIITLNLKDPTTRTNTPNTEPELEKVYIEFGDPWPRPPDCRNGYLMLPASNQLVILPSDKTNIPIYRYPNTGTILFCITYKYKYQKKDNVGTYRMIFTYERLKSGYISYVDTSIQQTRTESTLRTTKYLQNNKATTNHVEGKSNETGEHVTSASVEIQFAANHFDENKTGESKNDSGNNTAAIVGGVLGAVILVLVGVLLACWCSTARRRQAQATESTVVYTEIDELRGDAPPPPPRNQPPYAKILGTLAAAAADGPRARHDHTMRKEAPYATLAAPVTPKENLYCTVK